MNGEHPGKAVSPALQTGALHLPLENLDALTAAQYQAAVDALAPRLAELSRTEQWLNSLLCLLESYLSAFPSSTNTAESPDISLFDHLKTTAAIGVCISEYLAAEQETQFKKRLFDKEKQFMDEQAFLLYSADFSGIQKFIYTVASEKALRSLRSRSFFLELAMEHYADELLSLCGVGRTNLLYTGGGHCYMLLPNTTEVRAAIERWNRRFNDWLSGQFGISLFLAHGYTPCSGNELVDFPAERSPYKKMFRRVSSALAGHKLHRYDAAALQKLNSSHADGGRECKICGRTDSLQGGRCSWCRLFVSLSEKIQRCDIYFVSPAQLDAADFTLPSVDGMIGVTFLDEKTARSRLNGGEASIQYAHLRWRLCLQQQHRSACAGGQRRQTHRRVPDGRGQSGTGVCCRLRAPGKSNCAGTGAFRYHLAHSGVFPADVPVLQVLHQRYPFRTL